MQIIIFPWSVYEQHHLSSLINFTLHNKVKAFTLTERAVKNNLKVIAETLGASDNAFL